MVSSDRELLCSGWGRQQEKGEEIERAEQRERGGESDEAQGYTDRMVRLGVPGSS